MAKLGKLSMTAIAIVSIMQIAAAPAPRIFDFRGSNTETPSPSIANIHPAYCKTEVDDYTCTEVNVIISGIRLQFLRQGFYRGRIYSVIAEFDSIDFARLRSAFISKYGAPSSTSNVILQDTSGRKIPNTLIVWKFKEGQLLLARVGSTANTSLFSFSSPRNTPPTQPPKVDF